MSLAEQFESDHKARQIRLRAREKPFSYYAKAAKPKVRRIDPVPFYPQMWFWELISLPRKPDTGETPSLKKILEAVSKRYNVSVIDLRSGRRDKALVKARHIVMYLARDLTLMSLPQIGRYLGDRDHATILHGVKMTEIRMRADLQLQTDIDALRDALA